MSGPSFESVYIINVPDAQRGKLSFQYPRFDSKEHLPRSEDIISFCFPDLENIRKTRPIDFQGSGYVFAITQANGRRIAGVVKRCLAPASRGNRYDVGKRFPICLCFLTKHIAAVSMFQSLLSFLHSMIIQGYTMENIEKRFLRPLYQWDTATFINNSVEDGKSSDSVQLDGIFDFCHSTKNKHHNDEKSFQMEAMQISDPILVYNYPVSLKGTFSTYEFVWQGELAKQRVNISNNEEEASIISSLITGGIRSSSLSSNSGDESLHMHSIFLFQLLGSKGLLDLLVALLSERRVCFISTDIEKLSSCTHAALTLLYPMEWEHIFIPVLPAKLIAYAAAPMPILFGLQRHLIQELKEYVDLNRDLVCVDLDLGRVIIPINFDKNKSLKKDSQADIHNPGHTNLMLLTAETRYGEKVGKGLEKIGQGINFLKKVGKGAMAFANDLIHEEEDNTNSPTNDTKKDKPDPSNYLTASLITLHKYLPSLANNIDTTSNHNKASNWLGNTKPKRLEKLLVKEEQNLREALLSFFIALLGNPGDYLTYNEMKVNPLSKARANNQKQTYSIDIKSFELNRERFLKRRKIVYKDSPALLSFLSQFVHSQMFERFAEAQKRVLISQFYYFRVKCSGQPENLFDYSLLRLVPEQHLSVFHRCVMMLKDRTEVQETFTVPHIRKIIRQFNASNNNTVSANVNLSSNQCDIDNHDNDLNDPSTPPSINKKNNGASTFSDSGFDPNVNSLQTTWSVYHDGALAWTSNNLSNSQLSYYVSTRISNLNNNVTNSFNKLDFRSDTNIIGGGIANVMNRLTSNHSIHTENISTHGQTDNEETQITHGDDIDSGEEEEIPPTSLKYREGHEELHGISTIGYFGTSASISSMPSSQQLLLSSIIHDSYNTSLCPAILRVIWNRVHDCKGLKWKHAYRGLQLLRQLLILGSEFVLSDSLSNISSIKQLLSYRSGIPRMGYGEKVRKEAREVIKLLLDLQYYQNIRYVSFMKVSSFHNGHFVFTYQGDLNIPNPVLSKAFDNPILLKNSNNKSTSTEHHKKIGFTVIDNFTKLHEELQPNKSSVFLNTENKASKKETVRSGWVDFTSLPAVQGIDYQETNSNLIITSGDTRRVDNEESDSFISAFHVDVSAFETKTSSLPPKPIRKAPLPKKEYTKTTSLNTVTDLLSNENLSPIEDDDLLTQFKNASIMETQRQSKTTETTGNTTTTSGNSNNLVAPLPNPYAALEELTVEENRTNSKSMNVNQWNICSYPPNEFSQHYNAVNPEVRRTQYEQHNKNSVRTKNTRQENNKTQFLDV